MSKTYSIAEAKSHFARLVHECEGSGAIEVTRRGRPVAVVLSLAEYQRLARPQRSLSSAIDQFRRSHDLEALNIDPDELTRDTREQAPGEDFSW